MFGDFSGKLAKDATAAISAKVGKVELETNIENFMKTKDTLFYIQHSAHPKSPGNTEALPRLLAFQYLRQTD